MSPWRLPGATRDTQSTTALWERVADPFIDGVAVHEIRPVLTSGGETVELYRTDWALDRRGVDQAFMSILRPRTLSAWHAHETTTDRLTVAYGTVRIALFDARADSPTFGLVQERIVAASRRCLISIPPGVWHGVQNIGGVEAGLVNLVDVAYRYASPDHWRLPSDSPDIPYRWPVLP
jgi:dTDP-4-dehydrorhamnose 3,5-epimerase